MRIYALLEDSNFVKRDALDMQQKLLDAGWDDVIIKKTADIAADEDQVDIELTCTCKSVRRKSGKYTVTIAVFAPGGNESAWSIPNEEICSGDEAFEILGNHLKAHSGRK